MKDPLNVCATLVASDPEGAFVLLLDLASKDHVYVTAWEQIALTPLAQLPQMDSIFDTCLTLIEKYELVDNQLHGYGIWLLYMLVMYFHPDFLLTKQRSHAVVSLMTKISCLEQYSLQCCNILSRILSLDKLNILAVMCDEGVSHLTELPNKVSPVSLINLMNLYLQPIKEVWCVTTAPMEEAVEQHNHGFSQLLQIMIYLCEVARRTHYSDSARPNHSAVYFIYRYTPFFRRILSFVLAEVSKLSERDNSEQPSGLPSFNQTLKLYCVTMQLLRHLVILSRQNLTDILSDAGDISPSCKIVPTVVRTMTLLATVSSTIRTKHIEYSCVCGGVVDSLRFLTCTASSTAGGDAVREYVSADLLPAVASCFMSCYEPMITPAAEADNSFVQCVGGLLALMNFMISHSQLFESPTDLQSSNEPIALNSFLPLFVYQTYEACLKYFDSWSEHSSTDRRPCTNSPHLAISFTILQIVQLSAQLSKRCSMASKRINEVKAKLFTSIVKSLGHIDRITLEHAWHSDVLYALAGGDVLKCFQGMAPAYTELTNCGILDLEDGNAEADRLMILSECVANALGANMITDSNGVVDTSRSEWENIVDEEFVAHRDLLAVLVRDPSCLQLLSVQEVYTRIIIISVNVRFLGSDLLRQFHTRELLLFCQEIVKLMKSWDLPSYTSQGFSSSAVASGGGGGGLSLSISSMIAVMNMCLMTTTSLIEYCISSLAMTEQSMALSTAPSVAFNSPEAAVITSISTISVQLITVCGEWMDTSTTDYSTQNDSYCMSRNALCINYASVIHNCLSNLICLSQHSPQLCRSCVSALLPISRSLIRQVHGQLHQAIFPLMRLLLILVHHFHKLTQESDEVVVTIVVEALQETQNRSTHALACEFIVQLELFAPAVIQRLLSRREVEERLLSLLAHTVFTDRVGPSAHPGAHPDNDLRTQDRIYTLLRACLAMSDKFNQSPSWMYFNHASTCAVPKRLNQLPNVIIPLIDVIMNKWSTGVYRIPLHAMCIGLCGVLAKTCFVPELITLHDLLVSTMVPKLPEYLDYFTRKQTTASEITLVADPTAANHILEILAVQLINSLSSFFCSKGIGEMFPMSVYLENVHVFDHSPISGCVSFLMIKYPENVSVQRYGLAIIRTFVSNRLELSAFAVHSPVAIVRALKALPNDQKVQQSFISVVTDLSKYGDVSKDGLVRVEVHGGLASIIKEFRQSHENALLACYALCDLIGSSAEYATVVGLWVEGCSQQGKHLDLPMSNDPARTLSGAMLSVDASVSTSSSGGQGGATAKMTKKEKKQHRKSMAQATINGTALKTVISFVVEFLDNKRTDNRVQLVGMKVLMCLCRSQECQKQIVENPEYTRVMNQCRSLVTNCVKKDRFADGISREDTVDLLRSSKSFKPKKKKSTMNLNQSLLLNVGKSSSSRMINTPSRKTEDGDNDKKCVIS